MFDFVCLEIGFSSLTTRDDLIEIGIRVVNGINFNKTSTLEITKHSLSNVSFPKCFQLLLNKFNSEKYSYKPN